jgi:hypothetical protein
MERPVTSSNTDIDLVWARKSLPEMRSTVFLFVFLATPQVYSQQPYIPWSRDAESTLNPASARSSSGIRAGVSGVFTKTSSSAESYDLNQAYRETQHAVPVHAESSVLDASPLSNRGLPQPTPASDSTLSAGYAAKSESGSSGSPSGPKIDDSFCGRLFDAYFSKEEEQEEEEASHRQGTIIPFDSPPFPFADHIGPTIGYRDTTKWPLMEAIYKGPHGDWWKKSRIKIYGWADPSVTLGTSKFSNIPLSYSIVPRSLQLSQAILIFERVTDSVQTDHCDWGFKFADLYGIDYRYTTAKGWFSDQLLKHNRLYGYDPLQLYLDLYIPWVRQGMIIRLGRYISPIDIEAQLSPENYLYTHSLMYTYDPYTFTGLQFITKVADQWTFQTGVQAGNDMAPWTTSSQANGTFLLKWV